MLPRKKYFITAKIGIRGSPVSLGFHKGWDENGAIAKAKKDCPLVKDRAILYDFKAELCEDVK